MSMNSTPSSERLHIGFFGKRNAGKSSVVNAITNQDLSVVSSQKGTTTDPVYKSMELLPIGPVVIIDTPGFDDEGMLGEKRVAKAKQILNRTDVAVLIVDSTIGLDTVDQQLIRIFKEKKIPYIIVYNKCDLLSHYTEDPHTIYVSAVDKTNIYELKERIGKLGKAHENTKVIIGDLVKEGDVVVLVIPIDKAAPKGRIILPQQMVIRDLLDHGAQALVTRDAELSHALSLLKEPPRMVVTDSQVFKKVAEIVPDHVPLTSFSILMARYKGFLDQAVEAVKAIQTLEDGDKILISEGCTHHRQCDDIGTVKIPRWLKNYSGKDITFETSSGRGFPEDLSMYKLVIHCGACMLNEREVQYRQKCAQDQGIPFMNYGLTIAYMNGILERSLKAIQESEHD